MARCQGCSDMCVLHWTKDDGRWHRRQISAQQICIDDLSNWLPSASIESDVCIIFASANEIRICPRCRPIFSDALHIPEVWWSDCCRRSNGYFGCEIIRGGEDVTEYNTWTYFRTKHLDNNMGYKWEKVNVFARWLARSQQSIIAVFDVCEPDLKHIPDNFLRPQPSCFSDPFWVQAELAKDVALRADAAVWAVRDHVRAKEKEPVSVDLPHTDYRHLHDIARHSIHVSEILDVAAQTLDRILAEHDVFMASELSPDDKNISHDVHRRLRFAESIVSSLRERSVSNEKRLLNEIQLALHLVAQHSANVSVAIGRTTQSDAAAMRTIAFVTLAFLPPTFVSAIFSTSFFTFDSDSGWAMSGKIWVYWAFAVPLTLASFFVWHRWQTHITALTGHDFDKLSVRMPPEVIETVV